MKFYNIADEYINFLRTFDSKVSENKQESRPYIGVVIEIEEMKYYAPFTSPKAKHRKMKNGKDFRKIQLDQKLAKNDSTIYQILVKKQENLELYSILCKKPELEKMIPIPNKNLEKRQKIKIMDPNEKSEINK